MVVLPLLALVAAGVGDSALACSPADCLAGRCAEDGGSSGSMPPAHPHCACCCPGHHVMIAPDLSPSRAPMPRAFLVAVHPGFIPWAPAPGIFHPPRG